MNKEFIDRFMVDMTGWKLHCRTPEKHMLVNDELKRIIDCDYSQSETTYKVRILSPIKDDERRSLITNDDKWDKLCLKYQMELSEVILYCEGKLFQDKI